MDTLTQPVPKSLMKVVIVVEVLVQNPEGAVAVAADLAVIHTNTKTGVVTKLRAKSVYTAPAENIIKV